MTTVAIDVESIRKNGAANFPWEGNMIELLFSQRVHYIRGKFGRVDTVSAPPFNHRLT